MNEIYLYDLFASILAASKKIAGRFVVAEGYGNDLNANSFDNQIVDALGSISSPQKYPASVLMPPVEVDPDPDLGWSVFQLKMFFLTTSYHDSAAGIKGIAGGTNTSHYPIYKDWADMRQCAGDFKRTFGEVLDAGNILPYLHASQHTPDVYERYSLMNNDRVSGVCLSFEVRIYNGSDCIPVEDYPPIAEMGIIPFNPFSTH